MKRGGVAEHEAFGPGFADDTVWVLRRRNGELLRSVAPTAFKAAERVGLTLGELEDIRPVTE